MNDPYRTIGVSRNADEDEIKRTYRKLVKKYHPDRYQHSSLANEATEKMKEINRAYDAIMKEKHEQTPYIRDGYAYDKRSEDCKDENTYEDAEISVYQRVRLLIKKFAFTEAENILGKIPPTERLAEWYYLMGLISYNKGRLEDANNYIETAYSMDSSNTEYYRTYTAIKNQRSGTGKHTSGYGCGDCFGTCDCWHGCCDVVSDCMRYRR